MKQQEERNRHEELPGMKECLLFPLETPASRADLLVGGLVLLIPLVGWILNLGHRLDVVYRIYHQEPPLFRGFRPWKACFLRGLKAFTAISTYLSPAILFSILASWKFPWCWGLVVVFGALAIFSLPGGMTYNAAFHDIRYLYRPDKAFLRAVEGGKAYLWAWVIAIVAVLLSFLGLLALGIGFLFTSVWAWMVVGYAFSRALSLRGMKVET